MTHIEIQRRFSDLDPLGHVNNVAYHDYLQEARMGLIGTLDAVVNDDYAQIVVSQEIRHVKPLGYSRQPVVIEARVTDMARTSYTIVYRILDEHGDVAAEATTRLAVVDTVSGRPMRMPEDLRERLLAAI
ncbi:MAG: acyl-CoA thioesterase [Actinobacteria bacterium]|nr:acyl-CoA thioesterase [Actinomycetota bacterium]